MSISSYPQFLIDAHAITILVKFAVEKMEERKPGVPLEPLCCHHRQKFHGKRVSFSA